MTFPKLSALRERFRIRRDALQARVIRWLWEVTWIHRQVDELLINDSALEAKFEELQAFTIRLAQSHNTTTAGMMDLRDRLAFYEKHSATIQSLHEKWLAEKRREAAQQERAMVKDAIADTAGRAHETSVLAFGKGHRSVDAVTS